MNTFYFISKKLFCQWQRLVPVKWTLVSYVLNLGASLLLQSNEIYFINNIFLLITNFSLTTGSLVHWPSLPSVIYGEYISTVQITYRSYSVIRRTVFFKKFLISTKNYRQSLGASYRRIFSETIFFITVTGTISSK